MTRTKTAFALGFALALVTGCANEQALCTLDGVDVPCNPMDPNDLASSEQALTFVDVDLQLCESGPSCVVPVLPAVVLPPDGVCAILCPRRTVPGLECTRRPFPQPGLACCDCGCTDTPALRRAGLCGPVLPPGFGLDNPGYPR